MNFDFLTINLQLIYQPPLQILFTRAPPLVVVMVVTLSIPPYLFVDAVASILKEPGGVVDLTSPLLQIAQSAKCVISLGMWPCNVITGLITHQFDNSPQMQALLASPQQTQDSNWYPDLGATHHVKSDLANLNLHANEYHGSEQIRVGNGKSLPIKYIGTNQLSTPTTTFRLNNVLHVPDISNNLLSVHKFTNDTNTFKEFHPSLFRVKDLALRRLLLQGPSKHGFYPFPSLSNKRFFSPRAFIGKRTSFTN